MRVLNFFYKGVHAITKNLNLLKPNLFNVDIRRKWLPNLPRQAANVKRVRRLSIAKMD